MEISEITWKSLWKSEITLKLGINQEIWKSLGNLVIMWKSGNHAEIWKSCTHETLVLDPRPRVYTSAAARLFAFATSCPAQRGRADVQSGLPADADSLRETGSVYRYTPRGPMSHRIV